MPTVELFAAGAPITQGSAKIGRHGARHVVLHDKHDELMLWRGNIARSARMLNVPTLDEPVSVLAQFTMPKPARPKFQVPATKPDVDKLLRAVLDGLADGKLLREDSRVFRLTGDERYEDANAYPTGVRVWVSWGDDAGPQWFDDTRARLTV